MDIKVYHFEFPIDLVPFKEIPSLETFDPKYVYGSCFSLFELMRQDFYLVSIYNSIGSNLNNVPFRDERSLLFNKVIAFRLPERGKCKCIYINQETVAIDKIDLPHFRYYSNKNDPTVGNSFYLKDGDYFLFSAIKSTYEDVNHLEGFTVLDDSIIRLRIVIELLKINIKKGIIKLSHDQFEEIAFRVLKADPTFKRSKDEFIRKNLNLHLTSMLATPLLTDIPKNLRGKVKTIYHTAPFAPGLQHSLAGWHKIRATCPRPNGASAGRATGLSGGGLYPGVHWLKPTCSWASRRRRDKALSCQLSYNVLQSLCVKSSPNSLPFLHPPVKKIIMRKKAK